MTNREKYMKEIYKFIDSFTLANMIAVSKNGEIEYCGINTSKMSCEDCIFGGEHPCIIDDIVKWLDSDVEEPKPIQVSDSDYNKYALWIPENEKWYIEHKLKDKGEKEMNKDINSFSTQVGGGTYKITFETNNKDRYLCVQEVCRAMIDKEDVNKFIKIEEPKSKTIFYAAASGDPLNDYSENVMNKLEEKQ